MGLLGNTWIKQSFLKETALVYKQLSGVQRGAHTFEHSFCPKVKPEIATEMIISPPSTFILSR